MIVARSIEIDAAHYLPGYKGKCANLHGHRWKIELAVRGKIGNDGMLVDFGILDQPLKLIEDQLDHNCLNNSVSNPTAENLCSYVRDVFIDWWLQYGETNRLLRFALSHIKIWETEDSYAMLEEPE